MDSCYIGRKIALKRYLFSKIKIKDIKKFISYSIFLLNFKFCIKKNKYRMKKEKKRRREVGTKR